MVSSGTILIRICDPRLLLCLNQHAQSCLRVGGGGASAVSELLLMKNGDKTKPLSDINASKNICRTHGHRMDCFPVAVIL
jgi:hypothetical protein